MNDDLLGTVKAELSRSEPLQYLEHYIITDWLRALVTRCEQAEAEAEKWRGDYHNIMAALVKAEADLAALRQRHAVEVERAYHEGWSRNTKPPFVAPDAAWLASDRRQSRAVARCAEGAMTEHEYDALVPEERLATITRLERELAEARKNTYKPCVSAGLSDTRMVELGADLRGLKKDRREDYFDGEDADKAIAWIEELRDETERLRAVRAEVEAAFRAGWGCADPDEYPGALDEDAAWSRYQQERQA